MDFSQASEKFLPSPPRRGQIEDFNSGSFTFSPWEWGDNNDLGSFRVEDKLDREFKSDEQRGRKRARSRSRSPGKYSDCERTRSQSPAGSFYHGDSPARQTFVDRLPRDDRPYKCNVKGCEDLRGFAYQGGLYRHEREIHKMHPERERVFCPYTHCKRSSGTGFSRKENLAEHIRRVHAESETTNPATIQQKEPPFAQLPPLNTTWAESDSVRSPIVRNTPPEATESREVTSVDFLDDLSGRSTTLNSERQSFETSAVFQAMSKLIAEQERRLTADTVLYRQDQEENLEDKSTISRLKGLLSRSELQLQEALEDSDHYRLERDYYRTIVLQASDPDLSCIRPISPRLRRMNCPATALTAVSEGNMTLRDVTEIHVQGSSYSPTGTSSDIDRPWTESSQQESRIQPIVSDDHSPAVLDDNEPIISIGGQPGGSKSQHELAIEEASSLDPKKDPASQMRLMDDSMVMDMAATKYQYTSLLSHELRLLRISPGSFDDPISCSLKTMPFEYITASEIEFQALSYAWGSDQPMYRVSLSTITAQACDDTRASYHYIRQNLFHALKRIRLEDDYSWIWVDALCINQMEEQEKNQQLAKMPDIYSNAYNVIIWLGEDDVGQDTSQGVVRFIPRILHLEFLETQMQGQQQNQDDFTPWRAFSEMLCRPWFERRWVIQEIACAKRLSVRAGEHIISWEEFSNAVELFQYSLERLRKTSVRFHHDLSMIDDTGLTAATSMMDLARKVFRKPTDGSRSSALMSLDQLVLSAARFAVSEYRDVIYALLQLANDGACEHTTSASTPSRTFVTPDYAKPLPLVYMDFVKYYLDKNHSLDILYRPWATWPQQDCSVAHNGFELPGWVCVASFGGLDGKQRHVARSDLLGFIDQQMYHASRGILMDAKFVRTSLHAKGHILGTVHQTSLPITHGIVSDHDLGVLGWKGSIDGGIDDMFWRTLVADRDMDDKPPPSWYRRACALAMANLDASGVLNIPDMLHSSSHIHTLFEYLTRAKVATMNQKLFNGTRLDSGYKSTRNLFGLGPQQMEPNDFVCILYGSSVPVILRPTRESKQNRLSATEGVSLSVNIIGPCYVHDHMDGNEFWGWSEGDYASNTTTFVIK